MFDPTVIFSGNISSARSLSAVYDYLQSSIGSAANFEDLLRSQIVYSVSAFDKLIHDLIREGMGEIFAGRKLATLRYLSETITIQLHIDLGGAIIPPKEILFDEAVMAKLRYQSFQDPEKVSEGLSLIWAEQHKWQKIADEMQIDASTAKTQLKLISARRNAIVHEADMNPLTHIKTPIAKHEVTKIVDFLDKCGAAIAKLAR